MSMKRAQSAPQSIENLFALTKARAGTSHWPQSSLPRSKSYLVDLHATSSQLVIPWSEREDPFSLGGFFPASHRAVSEEWKWLRKEDDEDVARTDKESSSSFSVDDSDSALAEETIKGEDKFGVLSLDTVFVIAKSDVDERLFSPYTDEEAIDNDSLYLSHCARRQANSRLWESKFMEVGMMERTVFF